MGFKGQLELGFATQEKVGCFTESTAVTADDRRLADYLTLSLFATRNLVNLGKQDGAAAELASVLAACGTGFSLDEVANGSIWSEPVLVNAGGSLPKRFHGKFSYNGRSAPVLKMKAKGFGLGGGGLGYYSPTAVMALSKFYCVNHVDDAEYLAGLEIVLVACGEAYLRGHVTLMSQSEIAFSAAKEGFAMARAATSTTKRSSEPGPIKATSPAAPIQRSTGNTFKDSFASGREWLQDVTSSSSPEPLSSVELGLIWAIALWSNGGDTDQEILRTTAQMIYLGYAAGRSVHFSEDGDASTLAIRTEAFEAQLLEMNELGLPNQMGEFVVHAVVRSGHLDGILDDDNHALLVDMRDAAVDHATSLMDGELLAAVKPMMQHQFNAGAALANLLAA